MTLSTILNAVLWLLIIGGIYCILDWGLGRIGLPEPAQKPMNVILIVGVVACVINVILTLVGVPIFPMPHIGF